MKLLVVALSHWAPHTGPLLHIFQSWYEITSREMKDINLDSFLTDLAEALDNFDPMDRSVSEQISTMIFPHALNSKNCTIFGWDASFSSLYDNIWCRSSGKILSHDYVENILVPIMGVWLVDRSTYWVIVHGKGHDRRFHSSKYALFLHKNEHF